MGSQHELLHLVYAERERGLFVRGPAALAPVACLRRRRRAPGRDAVTLGPRLRACERRERCLQCSERVGLCKLGCEPPREPPERAVRGCVLQQRQERRIEQRLEERDDLRGRGSVWQAAQTVRMRTCSSDGTSPASADAGVVRTYTPFSFARSSPGAGASGGGVSSQCTSHPSSTPSTHTTSSAARRCCANASRSAAGDVAARTTSYASTAGSAGVPAGTASTCIASGLRSRCALTATCRRATRSDSGMSITLVSARRIEVCDSRQQAVCPKQTFTDPVVPLLQRREQARLEHCRRDRLFLKEMPDDLRRV
jgi:hypothetical protein